MRNGSLSVRRRQLIGALMVAAGLATAQTEAALAHHYTNEAPDAPTPCTSGWNTWGGDARSRTEPGVPGINVRITGSSETGYRYSGATPRRESHVRVIADDTLVADVGAYPAGTSPAVNTVTVTGTGTPSTGRTIASFCRFFDDPYREGQYPTDGSREHDSGSQETHRYIQPGYYGPWMHAIDSVGAWSIRGTDQPGLLYVNGPPTAAFNYSSPARVGTPVSFDAAASHDWFEPENRNKNGPLRENGRLRYAWDLDGNGTFNDPADGSTDAPTATYTYGSSSSRTVRLKVTDQLGTERLAQLPLTFNNQSPRAAFSFSPASPEAGESISFVSSSDDPDGTISTHAWDLNGDGKYDDASGRAVSFTFPVPGRYPVGLRVTDDGGREATVQQIVVVSPAAGAVSTGAAGASATATSASGVGAAAVTRRFVAARLRLRAQLTRRGARLRTFSVSTARGATMRVRCVGRDCRPRAQTLRSRGRLLRLKRFQRSYRAGIVLHVYVTQRGSIGRYVRIKIRRGRAPLRSELCLMKAGSSRPSRCR